MINPNYMAEITPSEYKKLNEHLDSEGKEVLDKCILRDAPLWFWEYQREGAYRKAVDEVYNAETLGEILKLGFNNTYLSGVECGGSVGWFDRNEDGTFGRFDNGVDYSGIPEEVLKIKVEDVVVEESEDYYTEATIFTDDEGEKIFTAWKEKLLADERWKEKSKVWNEDYQKYAGNDNNNNLKGDEK